MGRERLLAEVKFQAASVKKSFTMLVIKRQERAREASRVKDKGEGCEKARWYPSPVMGWGRPKGAEHRREPS